MNIVHISTSDSIGGSAQSAQRIHSGLQKYGYNSSMVVRDKNTDSPSVFPVATNAFLRKSDYYADKILSTLGLQYLLVPSNFFLFRKPVIRNADIFQLYNLHGGYFSINNLIKLSLIGKIVWRLSDLWPVTGHCAYPADCDKYSFGCYQCPSLSSYPAIKIDTTHILWMHKKSIYERLNMHIVAPSKWALKASSNSHLFKSFQHYYIPNGINQDVFHPLDRTKARSLLSINDNRIAILFIAHVAFNNPRKGSDVLLKALQMLGTRYEYSLFVAGEQSEEWIKFLSVPVHHFCFTKDQTKLALIYNAADIVCIPSSFDNLPNTVLEAMACAKPVIASNTGGIVDAVIDCHTGILFDANSPSSLANKISVLLANQNLIQTYGQNGLALINNTYSAFAEVSAFAKLYTAIT